MPKAASGIRVIKDDMDASDLVKEAKTLAAKVLHGIKQGDNPSFDVPSRNANNINYDEKKDIIFMGDGHSARHVKGRLSP